MAATYTLDAFVTEVLSVHEYGVRFFAELRYTT